MLISRLVGLALGVLELQRILYHVCYITCMWTMLRSRFIKFLSVMVFRNDLWALGCTLYQMLSGASPFKDDSEWLIFQRIITRDLRFPEYFSDEASDLIDKLLVSFRDLNDTLFAPLVPSALWLLLLCSPFVISSNQSRFFFSF